MSTEPSHTGCSIARRGNVRPIGSLTPYTRWTICARVTNKSQIRTWNNSRGVGKLFHMDLLDKSGEIRATAFMGHCDKYYDLIKVDGVYHITGGTLKPANKQFSYVKNSYELCFNDDTTVAPCEDNPSIPMFQFEFVAFDQLNKVKKDAFIDIIGVVKSSGDIQSITTKLNKEIKKRELLLLDTSGKKVGVTLWGDEAEKFDDSGNPVVAVKNAKISDFGGLSASGTVYANPDIQETRVLREWYDRVGVRLDNPDPAFGMKTLEEIRALTTESPLYFSTKATVVMVKKESCLYRACPDCARKVVDLNNGFYRCEKCQKEYRIFVWRLLLSVNIADSSGSCWVTCFQEAAETILGVKASELGALQENGEEEKLDTLLSGGASKSFIFELRSRMELFSKENKPKFTVVSVSAAGVRELESGQEA